MNATYCFWSIETVMKDLLFQKRTLCSCYEHITVKSKASTEISWKSIQNRNVIFTFTKKINFVSWGQKTVFNVMHLMKHLFVDADSWWFNPSPPPKKKASSHSIYFCCQNNFSVYCFVWSNQAEVALVQLLIF